jgi:hypothetical protein
MYRARDCPPESNFSFQPRGFGVISFCDLFVSLFDNVDSRQTRADVSRAPITGGITGQEQAKYQAGKQADNRRNAARCLDF